MQETTALLWAGLIGGGSAVLAASVAALVTYKTTSRAIQAQIDRDDAQRRFDVLRLSLLPAWDSLARFLVAWDRYVIHLDAMADMASIEDPDTREHVEGLRHDAREEYVTSINELDLRLGTITSDELFDLSSSAVQAAKDMLAEFTSRWSHKISVEPIEDRKAFQAWIQTQRGLVVETRNSLRKLSGSLDERVVGH